MVLYRCNTTPQNPPIFMAHVVRMHQAKLVRGHAWVVYRKLTGRMVLLFLSPLFLVFSFSHSRLL
jgi:hypothetical protein